MDNRLNEAKNRLDYWLTLIQSFGGESPILLVGNKTDLDSLDLDRRGLFAAYRQLQAILETSCATGEGIPKLRDAIAQQIANMPHVNDPLFATWFDVKSEIERLPKDYISYHRYMELCRDNGIDDPDNQCALLEFLHDLGVVLHFPDPRLESTNILNPEWVTQGVYRILNTRLPFEEQGILPWEMLVRILDDEPYQEKRMFIVDMMKKFELCYELPDRPNTYLIPDLLPKEGRDTGSWNGALAFKVDYSVLPGSILTRLIVRMHRHIKEQIVWRTGALLACEGNEALVRGDLADHRIRISVRGSATGRRELLTRIREHLGAIHASLAGLEVAEKVPVPEHPEVPPVDYRWLRDMDRKGISDFYPPGLTDAVSVTRLLNGVEPPESRRPTDLWPSTGPAVPPALLRRLRESLTRSSAFDSTSSLIALFVDARIRPWRNRVPETSDRAERVNALIAAFIESSDRHGNPALALFVEVLAEDTPPGDALHQDLRDLADDLRSVL